MKTTWTKFKGWLEGETEIVVTFPTYAVADEEANELRFRLNAWVYEPENKSWARSALVDKLRETFALEEGSDEALLFRRRVRPFLVDNERNQHVRVEVGGEVFDIGKSGPDGHVIGELTLPLDEAVGHFVDGDAGPRLKVRVFVDTDDDEREIPVLAAEGLSVVSDIDDTVKVTSVLDHHEMLRNTFLRPFKPVSALAEHYAELAQQGAAFHYVSASPWQLLPFFEEFMEEHGFPLGSFHLRKLRVKSVRSPLAFVRSSKEHKVSAITQLFEEFPRRQFVLVGDSGERDPEVYGDVARQFPERTKDIIIRRVEGAKNDLERFERAFEGVKAKWRIEDLI